MGQLRVSLPEAPENNSLRLGLTASRSLRRTLRPTGEPDGSERMPSVLRNRHPDWQRTLKNRDPTPEMTPETGPGPKEDGFRQEASLPVCCG